MISSQLARPMSAGGVMDSGRLYAALRELFGRMGLRSLRIGVRLTCCFAVMILIMLAGTVSAIWQINFYNSQVRRLSSIDRRMISVLKVNNRVLDYRELMQSAAIDNNAEKVREVLVPFRAKFVTDVSEASAALREYDVDGESLQRTIYMLLSYETAIPGEIDATLELAHFEDWQAIHYRLNKQMVETSRVLNHIVSEIETGANLQRRDTLRTMSAVRYRVLGVFPMCFCLILLSSSGLLGVKVTRSIAEPLHRLETGAKELGAGNFAYRVGHEGNDELATVARAFNHAAAQIERLHTGLESLVAERTADLRQANEALQKLSSLDPLTGIANRRTLDQAMVRELARAVETRGPISLLMVDIDHFKALNDTYGHQRGDECLIEVVRAIGSAPLQPNDLVARYGGEEFAVILRDANNHEAAELAEKVRAAVSALGIPNRGSPNLGILSISIGIATIWPATMTMPSALVEKADQALYKAKQNGRNRVWAD